MRRSLQFSHRAIGQTSGKALFLSSSSSFNFSTSAGNGDGDGGGRGRGRGSEFPKFGLIDSIPGKSQPTGPEEERPLPSPLGRGLGKPLPSPPNVPPISSFGGSGANQGTVAGRGRGTVHSQFEENPRQRLDVPPPPQSEENSRPRTPVFFRKEGQVNSPPKAPSINIFENQEEGNLPSGILSALSGAGRGKPTQTTTHVANEKGEEVNRHIKRGQPGPPRPTSPKMNPEEAINKARGILSRKEDGESETQGGFRGVGTRGGRGRGQRGGGSGRGRGRGRGMSYRDDDDDEEDEEETELDKANAVKLSNYLGPEKMDLLLQAYEEACANVLPSPEEDHHVDAMHTNLMLECEPEYLMAEFDSNPDIDEKPPISLRDALEKMKPFLMAYENIQTDKEWHDVVEETMKNLPLMKELVDYYSGPNKATAKKQVEELERVAKTLPASAPPSVKHFTDRAVLSLQSNPGWGFNRKCQLMDKLVWEVSQTYK